MLDLDKIAIGRRIREIRVHARLKQWELARALGTTQSAIHKYERGVVPEPRRLLQLARMGNTTMEWILTGLHGEGETSERERPAPALLKTALLLRDIGSEERPTVDEALSILRAAVAALRERSPEDVRLDPDRIASDLGRHADNVLGILEAAWRIEQAVLRRVAADAAERLAHLPSASGAPKNRTGSGT